MASSQVQEMYETVILYFAAGLAFAAFLRVTTSYFYAVEQNLYAYILIYGEPSLLAVLIALILPGLRAFRRVDRRAGYPGKPCAGRRPPPGAKRQKKRREPGKPDTVRKQEGRINVKEQLTQSDVKEDKGRDRVPQAGGAQKGTGSGEGSQGPGRLKRRILNIRRPNRTKTGMKAGSVDPGADAEECPDHLGRFQGR